MGEGGKEAESAFFLKYERVTCDFKHPLLFKNDILYRCEDKMKLENEGGGE